MTAKIIKKWIANTLKNDELFKNFCIEKIGSELNYYISPPVNDVVEVLPFMAVYTDSYANDRQSDANWNETWSIPMAIGIETTVEEIVEDGVYVWTGIDDIEEVASKVKELLQKEADSMGIENESINLINTDMVISDIGEADDIQASMLLSFGKLNGL